jgi:hypothetical protein
MSTGSRLVIARQAPALVEFIAGLLYQLPAVQGLGRIPLLPVDYDLLIG